MPVNLSRPENASAIEEFYTPIHERMTQMEGASGVARPTMAEFSETLDRLRLSGKVDPAGAWALDAGWGGTADAAKAFSAAGFAGVAALDLNEVSLREAKAGLASAQSRDARDRIRLLRGSVLEIPFGDANFGFASCIGVAHHTPDPNRAIRELGRVLKPGGTLYLSLYCFSGSLFALGVRILRAIASLVPFRRAHSMFPNSRTWNNFVLDHAYVPLLWLYKKEDVPAELAANGFEILEEWPSVMDPFASKRMLGRLVSGGGLMRVWVCAKAPTARR